MKEVFEAMLHDPAVMRKMKQCFLPYMILSNMAMTWQMYRGLP